MDQCAAWTRAIRLLERAAVVAGSPRLLPDERENAKNRLNAWRSQTPFEREDWFYQRLSQDALTQEDFLYLIGLSEESLDRLVPFAPGWGARLEQAYSDNNHREILASSAGTFTPLIWPLIRAAQERLYRTAEELKRTSPSSPFEPRVLISFLWMAMEDRLDWMLSRSVVLELHVAKHRGALRGETPHERFLNFLKCLSPPSQALTFFREYPVLARIILEALEIWEEAGHELLSRLCQDWEEILTTFSPNSDPGPLVGVKGGGDVHCRGRSVHILTFASGFRLVYKPRPVGVHSCFGELLAWLNERGAPGLRGAQVLEREGYGWLEFVSSRPCATREELARFYQRQGAFLALFYVLNATDLHRENLIAFGEYPIFVDLECLLTPDYGQLDPQTHDSLAHFEMENSVMRAMILPFFYGKKKDVIDPSGLGGDEGQVSVHEIPVWENPGTDEIRLVKMRKPVSRAHNRPTLEGEAVSPLDFREALEEGFASTYRLLLRHREELLAPDSPLSRGSEAEVRIVFRASQLYSFILVESYHPHLLRNSVDRERHLDRLWFGIDRSKLAQVSLPLLPIEREDLWRGDIPYFYCRPGSRDVWGSCGQHIPDLLRRSGLEMVEERLRGFGEEDLEKQLWFIRASLTALAIELQSVPPPESRARPFQKVEGREGILAAAGAISERLRNLALRSSRQAAWIGLAKTRSRGWWLRPLEADLYSGLPGVALYLAHSGEILGEPEHTTLAREALANLDHQLERQGEVITVGGFDGWGGLVYTWLHLGRLWRDEGLVQKAIDAVPKFEELIDQDDDMDIVRGCAGGIVPLLALQREAGCHRALELARRMGDRLVSSALPYEQTLYWQTASFPVHPLTGFSHGNSGMAWALVELFKVTGDERYRQTAARALAFERLFFSPQEGNWMDLRSVHAKLGDFDYTLYKEFNVAWCHGAGGIGLSRLRILSQMDRAEVLRDVEAAAAAVLRKGFGVSHCLCHGDLGNLELILEVSRLFGDDYWRGIAEETTQRVLNSFEKRGCLCGVPYFVETPGLMDGLAGIGYGLLRLAEPARVPSVLMLDLPSSKVPRERLSITSKHGDRIYRGGLSGCQQDGGGADAGDQEGDKPQGCWIDPSDPEQEPGEYLGGEGGEEDTQA